MQIQLKDCQNHFVNFNNEANMKLSELVFKVLDLKHYLNQKVSLPLHP